MEDTHPAPATGSMQSTGDATVSIAAIVLLGCCAPFGLCCEGLLSLFIVVGRITHCLKHKDTVSTLV